MSANHTRLDRETYEANIKELIRLEERKDSGLAARREIERMADRMDRENRSLAERAGENRRESIRKLQEIEQEARRSFVQLDGRIVKDAGKVQDLSRRTREIGGEMDQIISEARQKLGSAAAIMSQAKLDFQLSAADPDCRKFGQDLLDDLAAQLKVVDKMEQSDASLQQVALRLTGDIYALDVVVSNRKQQYELEQLEAQGLAAQLKNRMQSARENVRYGDETTDLVDLDYWTDNKFGLLEEEIDRIKSGMEEKRYDPGYGIEELRADAQRLTEIDRIQLNLVQDSVEKSNLSEAREEMAQVVTRILAEQYGYTDVIGSGFDMGDLRECYVVRLRRHTDGAQIEVLINPGGLNGENVLYFRIDTATYLDQKVMDGINKEIEKELRAYGIRIFDKQGCQPETLEEFNPANPAVSAQARTWHQIKPRTANTN